MVDREIENFFKNLKKALDKLARKCYNSLVKEVKYKLYIVP